MALSELVSFTLPHSVLGMGRDFDTFSAGKVPGRIKPQIVARTECLRRHS